MLRVSWKAGGIAPDGRLAALTDAVWEEPSLLDWTEEQKRSYLLDVWDQVAAHMTGAERARLMWAARMPRS